MQFNIENVKEWKLLMFKTNFFLATTIVIICLAAKPSAACMTKDFDDDVSTGCGDSDCTVKTCTSNGFGFLLNSLSFHRTFEARKRSGLRDTTSYDSFSNPSDSHSRPSAINQPISLLWLLPGLDSERRQNREPSQIRRELI